MVLSAVILAKTDSDKIFRMTMDCIESLKISESSAEIILVESNSRYAESYSYPPEVKVIVPDAPFNFHKFLNIGINSASGEFIALCNNDLLFDKSWFSEILAVAQKHPQILSFSPAGAASPDNPELIEGYKVMTHIKGWCLVARRTLFKKTGPLDEAFDFYYADNDYAMTLRSRRIRHGLVPGSVVHHLEKSRSAGVPDRNASFVSRYKIPGYLNDPRYDWLFNSEKNLSAFLKFHSKWGSPSQLYRKNKLADMLERYGLGFLVPWVFKIKF